MFLEILSAHIKWLAVYLFQNMKQFPQARKFKGQTYRTYKLIHADGIVSHTALNI